MGESMNVVKCIMCGKPAVRKFTWVNGGDEGVGSGPQGGPMCESDMMFMWDSLSRFPTARDTATIWPLHSSEASHG